MADIYAQAAKFRSELLQGELQSVRRMYTAFLNARGGILEELHRLLKQIAEAEASGEEISRAWLMRRDRLTALLDQTNAQISQWARVAEGEIRGGQLHGIAMGVENARSLVIEGLGAGSFLQWNALPVGALTNLVGFLGDGTPLNARLAMAGPQASEAVKKALIRGLALGRNPRAIAREVSRAASLPLAQALTISRTETLRAYREATRESYRANPRLVSGWRWIAALSGRTCAACAAMHGTVHSNDEPMGSHPNCRCVMAPVLLGREGEAFETGDTWLAKATDEVQDSVLGSADAGDAFRAGKVGLSDFVQTRHSQDWGTTRTAKSWKQVNPQ